ncbi:MAG: helix-turn-helix domain-containing protein [Firmicutes bacterium]|nr:helix-turn-helix domain-containing protein [Bacillota bacterium]
MEVYDSRVPWGIRPSLKAEASEVGIDEDDLIEGIRVGKSDAEMAEEFDVTEKLIQNLRDHFMRYGLDSIMGQD